MTNPPKDTTERDELAKRQEMIRQASSWNGRVWPEELTSNIMFWRGYRITRAEFEDAYMAEKERRNV